MTTHLAPTPFSFDESFIAKYKGKTPPWGPLGFVVFHRTYARWLPSKQRKETWTEVCQRVLEGNFNIIAGDKTITRQYAEEAFDHMWHMRWLPPGRGLWMSGTAMAKKIGSVLVNCWSIDVRPQAYYADKKVRASMPFVFAMDKLMLGGGVGGNISDKFVAEFPAVRSSNRLVIVCDPQHPNVKELDAEAIPPRDVSHTYIRVSDSRRGWTDALRIVIDSAFKNTDYDRTLVVDVSDVRRAGARIKGFGGTSAGPGPLVRLLRAVNDILENRVGGHLDVEDAADIFNMIGVCVVAGNVRRSSEILIGDESVTQLKLDPERLASHGWASNNSLIVDDAFDRYESISQAVATSGEPGIVNMERFRTYGRFIDGRHSDADPSVSGVNPCGEIPLANGEPCCLAEIFPSICLRDGVDVHRVAQFATHYAKRVMACDYSDWEVTEAITKTNNRIGVSISGWEDFKMMHDGDLATWLDDLYASVLQAEEHISSDNNLPRSVKVTTVKPSGSVSNLPGVSSGRHAHESAFYIRRIRMGHTDPLLDVLEEAGFHIEPDSYAPNAMVVEFPVKAPTADYDDFKSVKEYSLREQMEDQMMLQTYWADNSVSSTLRFSREEVDDIAPLLQEFKFKSTSLLPHEEHGYTQAPYEEITEEVFNQMSNRIKFWPTEKHIDRDKNLELVDQDDCAGGACPIK